MTGRPKPLHPVNPDLVPVHPGEVVAFREDHPTHGSQSRIMVEDESGAIRPLGTVEEHAKYGKVMNVGLAEDGSLAFDVVVFDPHEGAPATDAETAGTLYRATMGDIQ